ncbi:MAG TPA: LLM class F420-dependent oxidoreductase [Candidatus Binataceae bacterium]|nr:LLM class F420-dependent oxidoreductase [Candidatus Binataceae bacterium]
MKYGLSFFPTDFTIRFDELARAAEAHGFDSLLIAEHTHIPASRLTVPASGMRDLPPQYSHTLDPFVALAAAAAVTKTLKLGTGVCLVIERDPIITAKEVASLDLLSNGRFIFGVGAGWNQEEMENHGTEFKSRRRLMRERIEAMKAIWTQDEPAYRGKFVNFDPIWCYPKPVQKPWPPIIMGGQAPAAMRAAIAYADGWMPTVRGDAFFSKLGEFRELLNQSSDPKTLSIGAYYEPSGNLDQDRRALAKFADAEIDYVSSWVPPESRDKVLANVEAWSRLIEH